ncbi:hypothetical protein NDU88_007008 [Pleurodeles waltl]|uniref:Uncharacterized protein n=1 Tax=Pleurodeles waltl TaxID=8319 RepID=A0AAV7SR60_PLEWA|nr:hypothetical protein NDU88_007008 [Pleurodeles waltl]
MSEALKVKAALALLKKAGRMDLVREEALAPGHPARRASGGVAAAVAACSPPRAGAGVQVRGFGRGAGGAAVKGAVRAGRRSAGRRVRECQGIPSGRPQAPSGSRRVVPRAGKGASGAARPSGNKRAKMGGVALGAGTGKGDGRGSLTPGTPDLLWQDPLDFEEGDPGKQDAARSPWEEEKAGPGAAGRMTSAGRRGRRREAVDAPSGRCGGVGFAPPDATAWEEQRPGPSRIRGKSRGVAAGCMYCGCCGAGGTPGPARSKVEGEESLEEGELGSSKSETEWWERGKGWGDTNPAWRNT